MFSEFRELKSGEYEKLVEKLKEATGNVITVGVHSSDAGRQSDKKETPNNAEIAAIHEFGIGDIPQRSFMRSTLDEKSKKWINILGDEIEDAVPDDSILKAMNRVGAVIAGHIKQKITDIDQPPLSEAGKRMREHGGTNPLVDTGQLRKSITHEVQDE